MTTLYPTPYSAHPPAHSFFNNMEELLGNRVYPFSSARAGLVFGLRALGFNRLDEIFVPAYLSHCILSAISRVLLPALSPSSRTKAVLAWDPFGFPQNQGDLYSAAQKHGWIIVNDKAHSFYGKLPSDSAFDVFSLAKIFPCVLGGALTAHHPAIQKSLDQDYPPLAARHADRALEARTILEAAHREGISGDMGFEVEGVFGYLPEVVAFPDGALEQLPQSKGEIITDRARRNRIWKHVSESFPDRVPCRWEEVLAPFAIPIGGRRDELERASRRLANELSVEVPVLHFDFALNLLEPTYRPALMVGCHCGWTDITVERTIAILKDALL